MSMETLVAIALIVTGICIYKFLLNKKSDDGIISNSEYFELVLDLSEKAESILPQMIDSDLDEDAKKEVIRKFILTEINNMNMNKRVKKLILDNVDLLENLVKILSEKMTRKKKKDK